MLPIVRSINQFFIQLFKQAQPKSAVVEGDKQSVETTDLASAALMFEVIRADQDIKPEELTAIKDILAARLSNDEMDDFIRLAANEAEEAVSLYQFTAKITKHFNREQRIALIQDMWRLAYADNAIDKYEEHAIRKVAELIYVPHSDFIRAKQAARQIVAEQSN